MKLDRNKKYEGFGVVLESSPYRGLWQSTTKHETGAFRAAIDEGIMQMLLDAGHIKPVRETKIVRVEGVEVLFDASYNLVAIALGGGNGWSDLPNGSRSKPVTLEFEVEVDE